MVVGLLNRTAEVYDRTSLKLVLTLRGHEDHVWSVDMDKDIIVTGAWDSRLDSFHKYGLQISRL